MCEGVCARVRTRTLFKCQKRPNDTVKETRLHRQPFSLSLSLSLSVFCWQGRMQ